MKSALYIAWRYFFSLREKNVVNMITIFSMTALVCGVIAMVIVLSVFNGFDEMLQKSYVNIDPDIKIELREGNLFSLSEDMLNRIENTEGVSACAQILEYKMLAKSSQNQALVNVKGVSQNYLRVSNLINSMHWISLQNSSSLIVSNFIRYKLLSKQFEQEVPFTNIDLIFFQNKKNSMFPVGNHSLQTKKQTFLINNSRARAAIKESKCKTG